MRERVLRRSARLIAALVALMLIAGAAACASTSRATSGALRTFVQSSADDLLRQTDLPPPTWWQRVDAEVATVARQHADDTADVRAAIEQDPDAQYALAQMCELGVDAWLGEMPDNTAEWVDWLKDFAEQRDQARALAGDIETLFGVVAHWRDGEMGSAAVELAVYSFKRVYC